MQVVKPSPTGEPKQAKPSVSVKRDVGPTRGSVKQVFRAIAI
jgi:hypothetical protein